ncbi:glycoside hydrolase family protein [uncultured Desulfobacter sp.]|uniref:glycoside hydrolase family protein n=1 Tax=uncultured Desulfobacter sp. TaxID=240139 RepID=UPI0029F46B08|nr:glycoside hydrolase family protein [uncultured Desulfobacter sp.]
MDFVAVRKMLIEDEGLRLKPYKCTAGKLTIGVGRNIEDKGISENEAVFLLGNDISECVDDLISLFNNFLQMPENIQHVLINMRFQLGPRGFRGFRMMIKAAKSADWPEMIRQMKDSSWYVQTPNRANNLISMVEELV